MKEFKQLNKIFIFKYDPVSNLEKMLDEFQAATAKKLKSVEPIVLRCNSLEILLSNMNKTRWGIFQTLVNEKPNSWNELAQLLQKDYPLIKKEAESLTAMGIIELHQQNQEIQPIISYERIIFDLSAKAKKQREVSPLRV